MGLRLVDYLDKGASLDPDAPCLTTDAESMSYAEVQRLSRQVAQALAGHGVQPGAKVAILSGNDPRSFSCVFGISRAGAVWCPINPRNEAAENQELLDLFECTALLFQASFAPLVATIAPHLPGLTLLVQLDEPAPAADGAAGDGATPGVPGVLAWADFCPPDAPECEATPPDDLAMIAGTGGTTGRPKGVMLTGANLEAMSAIALMSYPFEGRPVYLALAPLTHAAGVMAFPIMTKGGEIVIMRHPDVGEFLALIERHHVTHTFLPPTLIYLLLGHEALDSTDLGSLQCFWYGAAPMSVTRLQEALQRIGPVMAQIFGQTEAPMMIATMPPADHFVDGVVGGEPAVERLASAGRPAPLVTVAIMAPDGAMVDPGERGEIVVRGSLVTPGYFRNEEATAEASAYGWHHTGDIGYLDDDGFLFIVDRAKDMIITGGFNVYSTEVEQALMQHDGVRDCAVIGLPDPVWGERVVAVVQPQRAEGHGLDTEELKAFVKARIGSVKTPKQIHVWPDLPRSKVGKVLKSEIKDELREQV